MYWEYRSRQNDSFSQISTASENGYELHTFGYLRSGLTGPGLRKINVIRCAPNSRLRSNASWPAHASTRCQARRAARRCCCCPRTGAGAGAAPARCRVNQPSCSRLGAFSSRSLLDDCFKRSSVLGGSPPQGSILRRAAHALSREIDSKIESLKGKHVVYSNFI